MRRPAACLFDLDGLLLDTEPLHAIAWQQAAAGFGLPLEGPRLLALRGRRRFDCARQVIVWMDEAGLAAPTVEALLAVRQPLADALMPTARPMPGARRLLQELVLRRIPLALVTSSSSDAVALKAAPHGWLLAAINARVHGDDPELSAGKPDPAPYLLAARRLGVAAGDCWAFEDSPAGALSASTAGCRVHVLLPDDDETSRILLAQLPPGCELLPSLEAVLPSLEAVLPLLVSKDD